jgi:excisionase family DNA binding protein
MKLTLTLTDEQLAELARQVAPLVAERLAREVAPGGSPWLSIVDAADYLSVSPRTIEREIARGRLHSSPVGRRRLIHKNDLDALARSGDGEGKRQPSHPTPQGSRVRGASHPRKEGP